MGFEADFVAWLASSLAQEIPESVAAFAFNLYQPATVDGVKFGIDLVGSGGFDEDDPDWACDEVWQARPRGIDIPISYSGETWQECLQRLRELVLKTLDSAEGAKLTNTQGVGIGFVDGEFEVIWKPSSHSGGTGPEVSCLGQSQGTSDPSATETRTERVSDSEICMAGDKADDCLFAKNYSEALECYDSVLTMIREANLLGEQYYISKLCLGLGITHVLQSQYEQAFDILGAQLEEYSPERPWGLGMMGLDQLRVSGRDSAIYMLLSGVFSCVHPGASPEQRMFELNRAMARCCGLAVDFDCLDVIEEALNTWMVLSWQICGEHIPEETVRSIQEYTAILGEPVEPHGIAFPRLDHWKMPTDSHLEFTPDGGVSAGKRSQDTCPPAENREAPPKRWWEFWK